VNSRTPNFYSQADVRLPGFPWQIRLERSAFVWMSE
jgi:hypothetical protein